MRDIAHDCRRIVGMVQHHGNERRIECGAGKIDGGRVGDKSLDIGDVPFGLQALQIGKRLGRGVDGVDKPEGTDTLREDERHKARPRSDIEHAIARFEPQRIHPLTDERPALHLAGIDFVPGDMAQILSVRRFLHDNIAAFYALRTLRRCSYSSRPISPRAKRSFNSSRASCGLCLEPVILWTTNMTPITATMMLPATRCGEIPSMIEFHMTVVFAGISFSVLH